MKVLPVLVVLASAAGTARAAVDDAADASAMQSAAPHCEKGRAHCFAIRLHVARTDAGAMIVEPVWFAAQLAMANKQFAALDTSFQLATVDFLPTTAARLEDRAARVALGGRIGGTVIDVFLTGYLADIDKPGAFAYGVTWRTKDERKFIIVSGMGRDRTLAHELGHFFGLPHSTYKVSLMNKTPRDDPPPEDRRFADEEIAAMKPVLVRLVRSKVIAEVTPIE